MRIVFSLYLKMNIEMIQKLHDKLQVNFKNVIWQKYCMFSALQHGNQYLSEEVISSSSVGKGQGI